MKWLTLIDKVRWLTKRIIKHYLIFMVTGVKPADYLYQQ